ncbi:hypothetical protein WAG28_25475 [Bacillus cereus]
MADKNERDRVDNDAGEAVGTGVGAVAGAALGSVLGPLGTVAGGAMGNKVGEGVDEANDSVANREDYTLTKVTLNELDSQKGSTFFIKLIQLF